MNCVVKYPQELGTFLFTIALGFNAWGLQLMDGHLGLELHWTD